MVGRGWYWKYLSTQFVNARLVIFNLIETRLDQTQNDNKRADQELGKFSENVLPKPELPRKTKHDMQKSGSPDLM